MRSSRKAHGLQADSPPTPGWKDQRRAGSACVSRNRRPASWAGARDLDYAVHEMGTVYRPEEIKALADFAHERQMYVHVDGARIANAAAALGQTLRQATRDLGVDVLSFGGTKNGILGGEAVVFFNSALSPDFLFLRKQGMQLASKMRFIAVQFEALLTNDLWRRSAEHANRMARLLEQELRKAPQVRIVWKVEANGVFAQIPRPAIARIMERYFYYPWIEDECIVRWMCSFDSTEEDVREFASFVAEAVRA